MKTKKKRELPKYEQLRMPFPPLVGSRVNHQLAKVLAEEYGYDKQGQCYRNAVMGVMGMEWMGFGDCQVAYVEGWLILRPDYAIEHGWLTVDGAVVDPTLAAEHEATDYYAVLSYSVQEVERCVGKYFKLPFFSNGAEGNAAMLDAFSQIPIHHEAAVALACLGYMETGIGSVIIPEGVFKSGR